MTGIELEYGKDVYFSLFFEVELLLVDFPDVLLPQLLEETCHHRSVCLLHTTIVVMYNKTVIYYISLSLSFSLNCPAELSELSEFSELIEFSEFIELSLLIELIE